MANNNSNNVIIITIIIIITVSVTVVVGFPLSVCACALVCVYERYCEDGECKESVAYFCAGMHTKQLKRNKTKRSETKQSHYWPSKTATRAHERQRVSTGKRGNANLRELACEERNSEKWWVCTARKLTAPKRKKHSGNETGLSAGHNCWPTQERDSHWAPYEAVGHGVWHTCSNVFLGCSMPGQSFAPHKLANGRASSG